MKPDWIFFGLGLLAATMRGSAESADSAVPVVPPASDLRTVLSAMIDESDHDFEKRFGAKIKSDETGAYYNAIPFEGMVPSQQLVTFIKGYNFFMADIVAVPSRQAAREAFFAMPQFKDSRGVYTITPDTAGSSPAKDVSILLLNGRRVANYTRYTSDKEDLLIVGPLGGRSSGPIASPDDREKIKAFTAGTRLLIERAGGNFAGMMKEAFQKTQDGDVLYRAELVPNMQTDADGQIMMKVGERNAYMNSYDDVKSVEFAFAAFMALPKNDPSGAYAVEVDSRLEKPSSTTYHLRYHGAIVADFIKFKTKPKAFFTFGYRDGIPKNVASGGGTYYSKETIEETKRMIHEHTVCPGCHGSGTEEVKTEYVYVDSGLPKMKTVPCHFCNGSGHL